MAKEKKHIWGTFSIFTRSDGRVVGQLYLGRDPATGKQLKKNYGGRDPATGKPTGETRPVLEKDVPRRVRGNPDVWNDRWTTHQLTKDGRWVLTAHPEAGRFQFRVTNRWVSGTHSRGHVQSFFGVGQEQEREHEFVLDADHPVVLVGHDNGPTPAEYLLAALASCLSAGISNIAAARSIDLTSVESTVEGDVVALVIGVADRDVEGRAGRAAVVDEGAGEVVAAAARAPRFLIHGEVSGAVSGGCVEGAVVEVALDILGGADRRLETFGYSDDDAFAVGLTCGGTIHLFVSELDW